MGLFLPVNRGGYMDKSTLAKYLDLANHHQDATLRQIKKLCALVKKHGFHSAFVNPCYLKEAKGWLPDSASLGTVIAFPLGQETKDIKLLEVIEAINKGADELDVSMNVGYFKSKRYQECLEEMRAIVEMAKSRKSKILVKFIIETGFLTDKEIKKASALVLESGADFIKTCSGMGPRGASLKDVDLIREVVKDRIKIKVAGGVDTYQEAIGFIERGADRIGTSQAVKIVNDYR